VVANEVSLTPAGQLVARVWGDLPRHYPHIEVDSFVVMPNHLHGILHLKESEGEPRRHGLSEIVRAFKTYSTRRINSGRRPPGSPVWQRNYYERVIRDESELERVRRYIVENPIQWAVDRENPEASPGGFEALL
jgi:REP element-mobilizing transposase RayT